MQPFKLDQIYRSQPMLLQDSIQTTMKHTSTLQKVYSDILKKQQLMEYCTMELNIQI